MPTPVRRRSTGWPATSDSPDRRGLAGRGHDHDPPARQAVAQVAGGDPQQHVGQRADQIGGAGQGAGAAHVQHQPGQGDQGDAAADGVHELGDQVEQAVP
jgi:hypothetical protein